MRNLKLREISIITEDIILPISGIIASTALKAMLAYNYSERLQNMYYDLIHDLIHNGADRPFSDGYDLVMTVACYLCEHIGENLHDMTGKTVMGKKVTILKGCYSKVQQQIRRVYKIENQTITTDNPNVMNITAPFNIDPSTEEIEKQHDLVEMLIQRMHLTELQLKILYYCLAEMTQAEIARTLCITENTVWESRRSIQKRYTRYVIQGKVHYKDKCVLR